MKTIVVLISGRGSNLSALIDAAVREDWPARIVAVISNREGADGLAIARSAGIPVQVIDHRRFTDRDGFDAALSDALAALDPDIVVLAGFMRVLGDGFVRRWSSRLINIHPSLLPAFPGLNTHRRALERGVRIHGATVHLVSADVDGGPIVAQAAVPVLPDDDEVTLAARVLGVEHRLLPMAVRWMAEDRLSVIDGRVRLAAPCDDERQGWWAP